MARLAQYNTKALIRGDRQTRGWKHPWCTAGGWEEGKQRSWIRPGSTESQSG